MAVSTMSRRGFVSAAGAASVLAACGYSAAVAKAEEAAAESSDASAAGEPAWTDTCDVLVLGGGGAGLNAAYRALELGASVIVLEKSGFTGGTLQYAEGAFQAVCDDEFALDDGSNPATANDTLDLMAENWLALSLIHISEPTRP